MAISRVGRGIRGMIVDFSEGWAFNNEVSNGSKDCGGKLAEIDIEINKTIAR